MERVSITERPDWREKAHEYGFNFHTMYGEPYWCEDAYYKLTLAQVEKLEEVTAELHQMPESGGKVIANDELMTKFRIPKHTRSFVRQSWLTHQPSLYSRLDLAWDGTGEPKFWKITPIRQRHYTRRRSFSGSGWKISLTPVTCRRAATSLTVCKKADRSLR